MNRAGHGIILKIPRQFIISLLFELAGPRIGWKWCNHIFDFWHGPSGDIIEILDFASQTKLSAVRGIKYGSRGYKL
ncbi:MAG: hypothetical protein ACYDBA_12680 [Sulfuricaulis sp.]